MQPSILCPEVMQHNSLHPMVILLSGLLLLQLRELELKLKQYGNSEMTTNPQDFISRKDHARLTDARINGREADLQVT